MTSLAELVVQYDDAARHVLTVALGESLRIGQFWLGVEFLLMALSRQDGPLAKKLDELNMEAGQFRALLRGQAAVHDKEWRDQRDWLSIGVEALDQLTAIDPTQLAAQFGAGIQPKAGVTPRMMTVLRDAVHLSGATPAAPTHLLRAALRQPQCAAVQLLLGILHDAGQDSAKWILQLEQEAVAPLPQEGKPPDKPAQPDIQAEGSPPTVAKSPAAAMPEGKDLLSQLGRDLTSLAQAGQLRQAIGESAHKAMV